MASTNETQEPRFSLGKLLIGKRLETKALPHQRVSKTVGLAVFASDALSSTAYATEEILIILAMASLSASTLNLSIPIAIAIAILLVIVTISYRQTIFAYPNGGGAYIVARDNLGELPAQIAGAALLTDYILTVAVSISSGVAQITSGFPDLLPYRVEMAIGVIVFMMIVNLRGVKESGRIFAIPTYFFLGSMFFTLIVGFVKAILGDLPDVKDVEAVHEGTHALTLFLVLRAFSSGCTALTGIEAISNGITAFKEPRSRNAAKTLIAMSSILVLLFLGVTLMAHQIHAIPSETETVISQIGRSIYGEESIFYILVLAGTALILLMAANTSYADFPRLAALAAGDGFLPRQLTYRGGRLVFSWGIVGLSLFASVLVIVADARTSYLIPLYAIGVFLSFTISQSGMVIHQKRIGKLKPGQVIQGREAPMEYDARWKLKMYISAFGAICTGVVMIVFAITKFPDGAWFVVLLIPTLVFIFFRIHGHYKAVAHALSLEGVPVDVSVRPIQTLILVDDVHAETVRLVNFAKSLQQPWRAVHIGINPDKVEIVQNKWQKRIGEGELVIIPSPLRLLADPLREYIESLQEQQRAQYEGGGFIHVVMGHLAMDTYWEQALHQNTAVIFNLALSRMENVVVSSIPYRIHRKHNGGQKYEDQGLKPPKHSLLNDKGAQTRRSFFIAESGEPCYTQPMRIPYPLHLLLFALAALLILVGCGTDEEPAPVTPVFVYVTPTPIAPTAIAAQPSPTPNPTSRPTTTPTNSPTPRPTFGPIIGAHQTAAPTVTPAATATVPSGVIFGPIVDPNYTPPPTATQSMPTEAPTVPPTAGPSPTPLPGLRREMLGIQLHPHVSTSEFATLMSLCKDLGVTWVKYQFNWSLMEDSPGHFNELFALTRLYIQQTHDLGFRVLISIAKAPGWSRSPDPDGIMREDGPPNDPQVLADMLTRLLNEVGLDPQGQPFINAIEVWNEPNLMREWYGHSLTGSDYMRYFRTAYNAIRQFSPNITIITAAPAPTGDSQYSTNDRTWMQQLYNEGLAQYGNDVAVGIHPYGWANAPDSRCCSAPTRGWDDQPQFFFLDTIEDYRSIMTANGHGSAQMWGTEFGWATFDGLQTSSGSRPTDPPGEPYFAFLDQSQQANFTLRAFELAQARPYLGPMILWNLNFATLGGALDQSDSKAGYGLLNSAWQPRPVYYALQQAPKQ